MKILITGNSGLVGTNLSKVLVNKKHKVFGISTTNKNPVAGVTTFCFDLRNKEKTEQVIKKIKPDIVYCLSANASESRGQVSPIDMTERNMNIFLHVLVPAINIKVKRFIYTSSIAVYGDADVPYAEDSIIKPKDIYGINKAACEQMLKILAKLHDFDYTIFRPHNLYGPHQNMSDPYRNVVALFMRNIIEDKESIIFGGGKMRRAFSYIGDVVDQLIAGLGEKYKNQTVNIGSSMEVDIATLLEKIEKIAGKKAIVKHLPARPQEIFLFLANHRKQNLLHPYKETSLDEGLQKTWEFISLPALKQQENEIRTK